MKAVVYKGPRQVAIEEVDDPKIEGPRDAIVKMTSTCICGSDLHMYEGRTIAKPGKVLGHEPLGVIDEVGDDVVSFKKGDRVVMPFNIACGYCFNCIRGYPSACLTVNPQKPGAGYGYAGLGPYAGAQAEFLRVPFADFNCTKLPRKPGDKWEDDFVLLADIFPTGFFATELAMVQTGATVAIFGAGPVGLLSAYSALLKGASAVYVVDYIPARLKKVAEIGAIPIDFTKGDPVDQIQKMRASNPDIAGCMLPGEEKMKGVLCGIDAVGYQAKDRADPSKEKATQVIDDLARLINATGHIGIIGVFIEQDPGAGSQDAKQGKYTIPMGQLWGKGATIGTGQTPVKMRAEMLRDLIVAGRAKPSFIVSHRISFDEVPEAYKQFDQRADGYTKVVIKPGI